AGLRAPRPRAAGGRGWPGGGRPGGGAGPSSPPPGGGGGGGGGKRAVGKSLAPSPALASPGRPLPAGERETRLMFMMSSGGLTAADLFQGKDAILSGPAGGVVGMAETGRAAGFEHRYGFDVGGTSTGVTQVGGDYERP